MTYPICPHYFSVDNDDPATVCKVEDETGRMFALAEVWAQRCVERGIKPPPDPLRALLAAAENLYQAALVMDVLYEKAMDEAEGGLIQ